MTRINTNVSSLVGRNNLSRANEGLNTALTRLSTGLRINTGADDPAGLIASEKLRSDITSIEAAIGNTERANQVIATADSALSEVSSLLNDIRGLVTESANSGALSEDQLNANQLQIDSSLEAINRIAQTTTFQGNNLLDGSLDFTTTAGTNFAQISDLNIDQANLGSTGSVSLAVSVDTAATQAQVDVTNIPATSTAAQAVIDVDVTTAAEILGVQEFNLGAELGTVTITDTTGNTGTAEAITSVSLIQGGSAAAAINSGVLEITADFTTGTTVGALETLVDSAGLNITFDSAEAGGDAVTAASPATGLTGTVTTTGQAAISSGTDGFTLTTVGNTGTYNDTSIAFTDAGGTANTATASYDSGTDTITVDISGDVTVTDISDAIVALTDGDGAAIFTSAVDTAVATTVIQGSDTTVAATATDSTSGDNGGGLTEDLVFELSGATGSEVFNVQSGTTIDELVSQINLVSDATGVEATANSTTLELTSTAYGSDAFVDVRVISEGSGTTPSGEFTTAVGANQRNVGADIIATINGTQANGDGNSLSINTATLDLNLSLTAGFTGNVAFDITGGGALFQLGPDVVSNQQARLGITSVNTARLGSESGGLYQLQSGGTSDLSTDPTTAAAIVNEAIDQITSLRGRLGAFQATTLDSNRSALNSTLTNLSEAESLIRDADFAAETANLTRSQILVQSGTQVLAIANQNPQNVLALLG